MWRHRFGGGFGPVVRQNTERMNTCLHVLLNGRQRGEAWEPSKKQCSFRYPEHWIEKYFHFKKITCICGSLPALEVFGEKVWPLLEIMTELKVRETMDLPALPHKPLWWAAWLNTATVLQLSFISKIVWEWEECKTWRRPVNVCSYRTIVQPLVTCFSLRKPLFNHKALNFEFVMDEVSLDLLFVPESLIFRFHLIFFRSLSSGRMEMDRSEATFRQESFQSTIRLKNKG